jgi:parallel beta-helix repeat protein
MGSKRITMALLLVTLFLISMVTFQPATVKAQSRTLVVPDEYSTIQTAINAASSGDTIYVKNGLYHEALMISKSLNLIGESTQNAIINGGNVGNVVQVSGNNVAISGFTIEDAGTSEWAGYGYPDSCIDVHDGSYVTISNTTLTNATVGVWLYDSYNTIIDGDLVFSTTTMGIVAYSDTNVTVNGNTVKDCGLTGIHLDGSSLSCIITNNTVISCSTGIAIEKSDQNLIKQCVLPNDNLSLSFTDSWKNQVQYCVIRNGVIGVGFYQSNDNTLIHNSFINNTKQVVPDLDFSSPTLESSSASSQNIWDDGKAGNYWSNYNGTGEYVIDANNVDHHPLTQQPNLTPSTPPVPEFSDLVILLLLIFGLFVAVIRKHRKISNLN